MAEPGETTDEPAHLWWGRMRPYTAHEVLFDAIVHSLGIVVAVCAGTTLLIVAAVKTAPEEVPALSIYVASLVTLFVVSLAFNMVSVAPLKKFLARLDQAAIFLLIAGIYTPVLALLSGTPVGDTMLAMVWGASLVGIALKLFVPQHFGRLALLLYAGIGWSGIAVFQALAEALPHSTLWLLLAGAWLTGLASFSTSGSGCISTTCCGTASSFLAPAFTSGPFSTVWC